MAHNGDDALHPLAPDLQLDEEGVVGSESGPRRCLHESARLLVEESRILRLQALIGRSTAGHLRNYVVEDPLGALVWGYFLNDGVGSKPSLTLQLAELRTQRCRDAGWHLDSIRNSRLHSLGRLPGG